MSDRERLAEEREQVDRDDHPAADDDGEELFDADF